MKSFLILIGLMAGSFSFAGQIRSVEVSPNKMQNIHLKLGQSTVLRFKETPKKVVVGNQNYFNIEFIGNDITIQPQAQVKSNLFVYGEYHTFGFILNAGSSAYYDDLVNVSWQSPNLIKVKRPKLIKRKIGKALKSKAGVLCKIESIQELRKNFFVLDFNIVNRGKKKIKSRGLDLFLSRSKIKLPKQRLIFADEEIESNLGIKGRLFFELEKRAGFTLHFRDGNDQSTTIISRSYLL